MSDRSDTDRRDVWWLDDATSLVIVGLVTLTVLGVAVGSTYAVATGAVPVDVRVSVTGEVPLDTILLGALAGVGWMTYVAFTDIYGSEDVEEATAEYRDATGDTPRQDRDQDDE